MMEDFQKFLESIPFDSLYEKIANEMKKDFKVPTNISEKLDNSQKTPFSFTKYFCIEVLFLYHEWNKKQMANIIDEKLKNLKLDIGDF